MIIARGLIKVYIFRLRCVRVELVCLCPQQPPALVRLARVEKLIRPRHIRQARLGDSPLVLNEPRGHYRARVSVRFQASPRARSIRPTEALAHDLAEATLLPMASSALCPNELLASLQELPWRSKTPNVLLYVRPCVLRWHDPLLRVSHTSRPTCVHSAWSQYRSVTLLPLSRRSLHLDPCQRRRQSYPGSQSLPAFGSSVRCTPQYPSGCTIGQNPKSAKSKRSKVSKKATSTQQCRVR